MNFLCISNHNNNVSWVNDYPNEYIIYDRSDTDKFIDGLNYIKSPNLGYNIYDICQFIIDNYDDLPDFTTFVKGNVFPRHITREYFEKNMDNKYFTPLFEYKLHNPTMPVCFVSSDGNCWNEINNSWYMNNTKKYFNTFDEFMRWSYKDHPNFQYISFASGANYVVPREFILKYPVNFYKNLKRFVSHRELACESHLIERALYTIWLCNYETHEHVGKLGE